MRCREEGFKEERSRRGEERRRGRGETVCRCVRWKESPGIQDADRHRTQSTHGTHTHARAYALIHGRTATGRRMSFFHC